MLSKEEQSALDRYRIGNYSGLDTLVPDASTLAGAVERLYPPGWNEPVTPERLVELGFETHVIDDFDPKFYYELSLSCRPRISEWIVYTPGWSTELPDCLVPRNMGEVRQLLERCGAIKETK
jgi:hypothetical protein